MMEERLHGNGSKESTLSTRTAADAPGLLTRRSLLLTVPAAVLAASRAGAQGAKPMLKAREMNHLTLSVSDPKRSLEFYQGLLAVES